MSVEYQSPRRATLGDAARVRAHAVSFRGLLGWRLRHVASTGFRLLTRRSQGVVLLLMMASPRLMPLSEQVHIVGAPVSALLQPGAPVVTFGVWAMLLAAAALWSALQPGMLAGGNAWRHLRTLPLPSHLLDRVDFAVLAVMDLPLMLPFAAAAVTLLRAPGDAVPHATLMAIALLAAQLPLTQLLVMRRSRWLPVALAGTILGLAAVVWGASTWVLNLCVAASSVAVLLAPNAPRPARRRPPPKPVPGLRLQRAQAPFAQLVRVDLRHLVDPGRGAAQAGLLAGVLLPVCLGGLLPRLGVRAEVIPPLLLILFLPLVFALAGRAFDLRRLHAGLLKLHASQGISPLALACAGLVAVGALAIVSLLPLTAALTVAAHSWRALWLLPTGLAATLACARLNQRGDQGMFIPKLAIAAAPAALQLWWQMH